MAIDMRLLSKEMSMEERVAAMKQSIGRKHNSEMIWQMSGFPKGCFDFNHSASADNIRRYVDGLGDLNPRFRDSEYAKRTKYGRLVAPALFLQTVSAPFTGYRRVENARPMHSASEWEFFQPILEDDQLDYNGIGIAKVELKKSAFSGQMLETTSICEYRNQRGVLAVAKGIIRHSASDEVAVRTGKYKHTEKPYRYSDEELRRIEKDYEKEELRGSQPRYWEDVVEGESIPHIVDGPRTLMEAIAWVAGQNSPVFTKGPRLYRMLAKSGTRHGYVDPATNITNEREIVHFDTEQGKRLGTGGAYDAGIERETIVAILFENWIGDDGFLAKFSIQFRRFVLLGDTNWYKGKVVRKYIDDGKCCVDVEYSGENQRREITTQGGATVILPSKVHGPVKYPTPRSLDEVFAEIKG